MTSTPAPEMEDVTLPLIKVISALRSEKRTAEVETLEKVLDRLGYYQLHESVPPSDLAEALEIDDLRKALEPFAKLADVLEWRTGLDDGIMFRTIMVSLWDDITITVGDLRRARAAYSAPLAASPTTHEFKSIPNGVFCIECGEQEHQPQHSRSASEAVPVGAGSAGWGDALMQLIHDLHKHLPEADRPMSWSDLSDAQRERLQEAGLNFAAAILSWLKPAPIPPESDALFKGESK